VGGIHLPHSFIEVAFGRDWVHALLSRLPPLGHIGQGTPVMPCIFCRSEFDQGQRRRTREHVFAEWMVPYLKSPAGPGTQVRWNKSKGKTSGKRFPAYPAHQAVQDVCHECNSGWLSRIQTDAKPHLLPALKSTGRRTFGESAQAAMSLWAFRAALVVGVKAQDASIPPEHLHELCERQALPDSTRVFMVATRHREFTYIDHRTIKVEPIPNSEPPPSANAFATLIGVGHIAFYVLCWTDIKPRGALGRVFEVHGDSIHPIHPSRGIVIWPPQTGFSLEGLDDLAGVIGYWEE
jgi:hypothetical protein